MFAVEYNTQEEPLQTARGTNCFIGYGDGGTATRSPRNLPPCSRLCIATEAVPFASSLPRPCHASANLPRGASQAHSCRRTVALVLTQTCTSLTTYQIVRTACARIASTSRTKVRLACVAPPWSYHSGLFGEISLDWALLQLFHVAAASCTVNFEFDSVSANRLSNWLSLPPVTRAHCPQIWLKSHPDPVTTLKCPHRLQPQQLQHSVLCKADRRPASSLTRLASFAFGQTAIFFSPRPQSAFQVIFLHV